MSAKEAFILYWTGSFDYDRRSRRREYWLSFLVNMSLTLGFLIAFLTVSSLFDFSPDIVENTIEISLLIITLTTFLPGMAITARRLQDLNLHRKWAIILSLFSLFNYIILSAILDDYFKTIVPHIALNLWNKLDTFLTFIVFILMCWPGTDGPNKYGEDPKAHERRHYVLND